MLAPLAMASGEKDSAIATSRAEKKRNMSDLG